METEALERSVKDLLQPVADGAGAVVESVRLRKHGAQTSLEVIVDRLEGTESLPLDDLAELSRGFSDVLDDADPIADAYSLEVSTPGAERELKESRHYQRNLGRQLRVKLKDGQKFEGILAGVGPQSFQLDTASGQREIPFEEVRRAKPRVTF